MQSSTWHSGYGDDEGVGRPWGSALLSSVALYASLAVVLGLVGSGVKQKVEEELGIKFTETVVKEVPPPPPPPPPPAAPIELKKPKALAAVVPKDLKKIKVAAPPPPPPEIVPTEMPQAPAPEADAAKDFVPVTGDEGDGDPAGLVGGSQHGRIGGTVDGAVDLPTGCVPPKAKKSNKQPDYPAAARKFGEESFVVLRIVVNRDGDVEDVEVKEGAEPFASAATKAVKRWNYSPAECSGEDISVYHLVRITFRLED